MTIRQVAPSIRNPIMSFEDIRIPKLHSIKQTGQNRINRQLMLAGSKAQREAAIEALKQWRFSPVILNGEPCWMGSSLEVIID